MTTKFLQQDLWAKLSAAIEAQGGNADVAVAYFGNGAQTLLPLAAGSRLVVNASDEAVKAGSTSPSELIALHLRGVAIYSVPNLHAKLFLVGDQLFVGSSNASLRSAEALVEAMLVTEDVDALQDARSFFDHLVMQPELGKAALERLLQIYVPPKLEVGQRSSKNATGSKARSIANTLPASPTAQVAAKPTRPTVWLTRVSAGLEPSGSESVVAMGKAMALTKLKDPGKHKVDYQWDSTNEVPYGEGDLLIRVWASEEPCLVEYPVTVLHIRKWVGQETSATFVFLETLVTERTIPEHTALQRLGWSKWPELEDEPIALEDADKIFALWK